MSKNLGCDKALLLDIVNIPLFPLDSLYIHLRKNENISLTVLYLLELLPPLKGLNPMITERMI